MAREAEPTASATAAAAALRTAAHTSQWHEVRRRLVALVTRSGPGHMDEEALTAELDTAREHLLSAEADGDDEAAAAVVTAWRLRLRRLLAESPALAPGLRALLEDARPDDEPPAPEDVRPGDDPPAPEVHNVISGGVHHGPVIQARTLYGLTFPPPDGRTPPGPPSSDD
ncbi:hypothetical protein FCH28_18360 [Streptomyces piniterrae]|uniref:Uncharacterized protein n=1 Tax=Streptomyces piniterrae TaxID=2571125 RepID=A0A4V5MKG0_9ACTN|nr:hypothetical protein [Streptomyces piniterrae]TJZ53098.1 hypothetical protein FCH28_18360 [Streptomyces piniterrae]